MNEIKKEQGYVVGIGELLWDCFPSYRRIGGAPANFTYHAAQFGHNGVVVSAIGRDQDGEALKSELEAHHLSYNLDHVNLPTGTVDVDIDEDAKNDPIYTINTNVAWSIIPYTEKLAQLAAHSRAICFGTLAQYGQTTGQTITRFLSAAPKDCYRVFDINLRESGGIPLYSRDVIHSSLRLSNILKVNISELKYLAKEFNMPDDSIETIAHRIMKEYDNIHTTIVTLGEEGSWVFGKDECSYYDTPEVDVVDVVGAGDAFTGAFVGSLLNGKTLREAHHIAVNVSAYVCTQESGMPVIPEWLKSSDA